jgi:hypothetical protein
MAANNALQLTSVDFDGIKNDLKTFLSNQTELGDYNYESSTMQILLNLLAYNTYRNSFYLNMVGNEMFLDSAQIRSNVVSKAKMLGYTPRSIVGPEAEIQVTVLPDDSPSVITINANTVFTTLVDGKRYVYTNPKSLVVNANASGVYSGKLPVVEGRPFTHRFTVSSASPVRYVIPNDSVDTTNLTVRVQESSSNTTTTTWTQSTDITGLTANSRAYFLSENEDGRYEVKFGDNVISKRVNDGNIVLVGYRVSTGLDSVGVDNFASTATMGGYSNYTLKTTIASTNGSNRETIDSIKLNAPRSYSAQNRVVTAADYRTLITSHFTDLQAVSVWGGEENDPPIYGKVFISAKPKNGLYISDNRKNDIINYLKDKTVLSIDTEVVDSAYMYVRPTINVSYNPDDTTATASGIASGIENILTRFETNTLNLFGKEYINSDLATDVNNVNSAIKSVRIEIKLEKDFKPITTASASYNISFNNSFYHPHMGHKYAIASSSFTYEGRACFFDDNGNQALRIYTLGAGNQRTYLNENAGKVDYNAGRISINNILISAYEGDAITFLVDPDINDIKPQRNQLLLFRNARVNVTNAKTNNLEASISNVTTTGTSTTTAALSSQSATVGLYSTVY